MNCNTPVAEVCFTRGVLDAFVLEIPNATVDPLGYSFKLGTLEYNVPTDAGSAVQSGDNVIVTVPVNTTLLSNNRENGHIVSNTKTAGSYESLAIKAVINDPIDAV